MKKKTWLYFLILSMPFAITILFLGGLTQKFNTVGGNDETTYHYPTILKLADDFPKLDFTEMNTATGPLYHTLTMLVGKIVGFEIYKLRLMNALISYLAIIALFQFLILRVGVPTREAFLFSLLFCLSPYFFGVSFLLFTDNLGWLFCILTLDSIGRFQKTGSLKYFVITCFFWTMAIMTRQYYVWLVLVGLFYLSRSDLDIKKKGTALALTFLSFIPFGLLILQWKGLTPPAFTDRHMAVTIFNFKPYGFVFALTGLYAPFVISHYFVDYLKSGLKLFKPYIIPMSIGIIFLLIYPIKATYPGCVGFFWRMNNYLPVIFSTGLLFWIFVPLGLMVFYKYAVSPKPNTFVFVYLASFLLIAMASVKVVQKYFDPVVLLLLFIISGDRKFRTALDYIGFFALMGIFLAYIYIRCFFEGLE